MVSKLLFKQKAINLRKQGLSYSEILKEIPVAKSTLSLWLHSLIVGKSQQKRLRNKLFQAQLLGGKTKRRQREEKTEKTKTQAFSEINKITRESLLLMGTMLYWAEGSKERNNIGQQVAFTNSDPLMCLLFLKWIRSCLKVSEDRIVPRVYIHSSQKTKNLVALRFWSRKIGISENRFAKSSFTNTKLSSKRRKNREEYYGQLRITVKRSVDLNRKISGWVEAVCIRTGVLDSR